MPACSCNEGGGMIGAMFGVATAEGIPVIVPVLVLLLEGHKENRDKAMAAVEAVEGELKSKVPRHHRS